MTQSRHIKFSSIALALGSLALLACIVHFWILASAPSPPIEDVVADKVVAIRDATIDRLAGRAAEPQPQPWGREQLFVATTSFFGGLAIVFAAVGYVRKEPRRSCAVAAGMGAVVVVFPYVAAAVGTIIVILVLLALLSMFSLADIAPNDSFFIDITPQIALTLASDIQSSRLHRDTQEERMSNKDQTDRTRYTPLVLLRNEDGSLSLILSDNHMAEKSPIFEENSED